MTDHISPRIVAAQRRKRKKNNTIAALVLAASAAIGCTARYAVDWDSVKNGADTVSARDTDAHPTQIEPQYAFRPQTMAEITATGAMPERDGAIGGSPASRADILPDAMIPDGAYVMYGSYSRQENLSRVVDALKSDGRVPIIEATPGGTRVLIPYATMRERQALEAIAQERKIHPVAIKKIDGRDHYLPPTGSSERRYTSITDLVAGGDISIDDLPYSKQVRRAINDVKSRYDIHDEQKFTMLAYAVMWKESDGDKNAVSSAGAVGPMQVFYPTELSKLGFGKTLDDKERMLLLKRAPGLFNLDKNITDGITYLAEAVDIAGKKHAPYSDEHIAFAGAIYNMGLPNVNRGWHRKNPETKEYMANLPTRYAGVRNAVAKPRIFWR